MADGNNVVHTHDEDGFHVQPTREGDGKLIVHVKPVKLVDLGSPSKAPLIEDVPSGRDLERREREMRKWLDAGYDVAPVPEDGREHQFGKPCKACNS